MSRLPTVERAWHDALYTGAGFYLDQWPARHFSTATQVGSDLAATLAALAHRHDLDTVVDVGAGGGELVTALHAVDPALRLVAVELRPRPARVPTRVVWRQRLPTELAGLVVGNELLDTIPCPVVEVDGSGEPRVLLVDPATGVECAGPAVVGADLRWLERWWPTVVGAGRSGADPAARRGLRAEVGRPRDDAWAGVVGRVRHGLVVAIDYGHRRADRPAGGSLRSYRSGSRVPVAYDGRTDITADVAVDAVADRVAGSVHRQRDLVLADRPGQRPGRSDRLAELARAGRRAEVRAVGGLGELSWILSPPR